MKVKIENVEEVESKIVYPCLMEAKNGVIVLFYAHSSGVAVKEGECNDLGEFGMNWIMEAFKPFKGKITLSND